MNLAKISVTGDAKLNVLGFVPSCKYTVKISFSIGTAIIRVDGIISVCIINLILHICIFAHNAAKCHSFCTIFIINFKI